MICLSSRSVPKLLFQQRRKVPWIFLVNSIATAKERGKSQRDDFIMTKITQAKHVELHHDLA